MSAEREGTGTSDGSTGVWHRTIKTVGGLLSSIRTKIVLPYAVLTLAVAAVGTFVVTQLVAGSLEERFNNQLVEAGRVTGDSIVRKEQEHLRLWRAMAFTEGVNETVASKDIYALEKLLVPVAVNHGVHRVEVADDRGRELLGFKRHKGSGMGQNYTLSTGNDLSTWPIVGPILAGQVDQYGDKFVMLVKEPEVGYVFYTGGPVKQDDRVVGAVLLGTYLDDFLADVKQEVLADITFYSNNGEVLATTLPGGEEQIGELLQVSPAFCQSIIARHDETLRRSITLYGRSYWMVYGPLQIRGTLLGIFSAALPTNFIVQKAATSRLQFGLLFTSAMVLVFIIGYLISRRIIVPIMRLVQTSRAVAAGDLSQQTGIRSSDEIGTLASTFDQMTRKLRERTRELEEEASKIRAILESIADGVIVEDKEGRIIMMNPAAERILGSMSEDFLVSPIRELPPVQGSESSSLSSGDRRFEASGRVVSAREAPVVTQDGVELGKVMVFRDITREVEVDRLKDEFIENVSHELRTPLTSIKGHIDLLELTAKDKLNERQRKSLRYISERSSQLVAMIGELLDMTDIAAGTLGLDLSPTSLDELILEVIESLQERIEEKQLTAIAQLPEDLPQVSVDRDRIKRVLYNLISNSCNYTMPGGRITVTTYVNGDKVRVDVEDNGIGISKADQARLFTRFFRGREMPHDDVRGAGLGLYMAKALIEAHGERIWLERSTPGEGSVFSFTLPIAENQESKESNSLPASIGAGNTKAVKPRIAASPQNETPRRARLEIQERHL